MVKTTCIYIAVSALPTTQSFSLLQKLFLFFFFFHSYFINGDMWWCLSCNKCTYCKQFPKCKFKVLYNPCKMPACSPGVIQPFLSKVPYGMFRFSYSNTLTHQWKYNGIYSYHVQRHFDIQLEQGMEPLTFWLVVRSALPPEPQLPHIIMTIWSCNSKTLV